MTQRTLLLFALLADTACAGNQPTTHASSSELARAARPAPAVIEATEWWTSEKPCLDGAELKGAAPPRGNAIWCEAGGQVHGTKTTFHANGKQSRTERFYRGKLEGAFAVWHENGALAEEGR